MKRFGKISKPAALALCMIMCLTACGRRDGGNAGNVTPDPTPTEASTPTPTPTPTFTPTPSPTPRPAYGVTRMSLYKNIKDESLRRKYGEVYESVWEKGKDITSFECIASTEQEIPNLNRYFQDIWREEWNRFENHDVCKICYRVQFETTDGVNIDKMLMKPGDELEYRDYIENYLYDDIHQVKGKWYTHLSPEDINDSMILSSLKFTAGQSYDKVMSPITVSAYVYYSDEDFDEEGNYIGALSYTVNMMNMAEGAPRKYGWKNYSSTEVEPTKPVTSEATSLSLTITNSNGKGTANLRDNKNNTKVTYAAGDTITVSSETEMAGLYLLFGDPAVSYQITAGGVNKSCGEYGFLHDYVELDTPVKECTIKFSADTSLCGLYAYSTGTLPDSVQVWQPPYEKADMVIFSTHADDEVLFMGGVAITYAAVKKDRVQIVYLSRYWKGPYADPRREHEKLDGLWTMGIRAYPVNMPFDDYYSTTLADAKKNYDLNEVTAAVTENIRRFKPLVVVTHDVNGEYGHGGHMLLYQAVNEAVNNAANADFCPSSATQYGTWEVPKFYSHLYGENKMHMNFRTLEPELGWKTVLDVEKEAYKKHVTQQGYWFYVSDDYEYSCADFGLVRSAVGLDTGTDMFENLKTYGEQEEEARRLEEERLAEEARIAEENRIAELTQAATEENNAKLTEAAKKKSKNKKSETTDSDEPDKKKPNVFVTILLVVVGAVILFLGGIYVWNYIENEKRKKRRAELRRKARLEERNKSMNEEDDYL